MLVYSSVYLRAASFALPIVLGAIVYGALILDQHGARAPTSAWELAVETACNPHYITWVVLTSWLLRLLIGNVVRADLEVLIRLGSYRRLAISSLRAAHWSITATVSALVLAWLIGSSRLRLPWVVGEPSAGSATERFASMGISAPVGLVLQVLTVSVVLLALQLGFATLRIGLNKPAVEVGIASLLWLWAGAAAMGAIPGTSQLNSGLYLNASLIVTHPEAATSALFAAVVLVVASAGTLAELDRRSRGNPIPWDRSTFWFVCGSVAVVGLSLLSQRAREATVFDAVSSVFLGSSGSIVQFFSSAFLFIGYAFMRGLQFSKRGDRWIMLELLRDGSLSRWCARFGPPELIRVAGFVTMLLGSASVLYVLAGGRDFSAPVGGVGMWLFQFMVNGMLQLCVYVLVILAVAWMSPNKAGALLAAATLVVLAYVQATPALWLPVQLSGMALTSGGWSTMITATGTLIAALVVVGSLVPVLFRWQQRRS